MRIAVLGPLEVRRDTGDPVAVPGAKERLLLAVLAADTPDVVSTDRIVETLWNGDHPASARSSLLVHLVHLRSALEPDRPRGSTGRYILRRGAGYSLAADRDDVDALRFTDLAARGRALLAAGDAAAAVRSLAAALDLWRGEPYGDWPDAAFADTERRRLAEVRAGAVTALLEARLALGEDAEVVPELEQRLAGDPLQEEWWRLLVLALYRSGRQGDALAAAQRARRVLAEELGTDPGPRLRAVEAAVLAQDPLLELPLAEAVTADSLPRDVATCPYKGLATYEATDAELFHGRRRLVTHLVARLVDAPLLVVSGPSGAGKSSVVRAGLVPALARDALPGSARWRTVVLTPGRRPVDRLAELTGETPPDAPVLLVCDQFEELWAPGVNAAERTAFLDTVLGLLADGVVVRCVAVVRGDHVGLLAEHTALAERVGSGVVLVPSLTDDELREVVVEPAAAVGLDVEPDLVDAVVADVRGRPGALPLLSVALVGTWERRRGDRLTLAGYLEAGGVAGALTRSADAAYAVLDEPGREVARRLLVRLADTDEAGALVRRPAPLAELDLDGDGGDVRRAVIESFVARRLLTVDGERLDVAHEALLTAWPRLTRWLDDDAAGRAVRRHLTPAAQEWQGRGEPDEELYRGARLAAALDWAAPAADELTAVERRFLDASSAHADAELLAAREQTRREAAGRRRSRRLAVGLAAVLVVALVATGLAVAARRAADRASLLAEANRLAALSTSVESLDLAYLLAAQAYRLADTPEAEDALLAPLVEHRRAVRAAKFSGTLFAANLGNDGRTFYIGAGLQVLKWDIASGEPPSALLDTPEVQRLEEDGWGGANSSPTDDRTVYVGTAEGRLWLRMADGSGRVSEVSSAGAVLGEPIGVAFTPDGDLVNVLVARPIDGDSAASSWRLVQIAPSGGAPRDTGIAGSLATEDGGLGAHLAKDGSTAVIRAGGAAEATLVDLRTGSQATVAPPAREGEVADFRALSSGAAVLWNDGLVTLVDRAGAVAQELRAHRGPVWDVALAPDGSWAATVGEGGEVVLWDVDPATGLWSQRESLEGHDAGVFVAEIDPAGEHLVTASGDNQLIVWDVRPDGGFGTSHPGIPGRWVAGPPAVVEPGRLVVVPTRPLPKDAEEPMYGGEDTLGVAATFVDPRTGGVVDQVDVGDTVSDASFGASVAVSFDRRWIAVTSGLATTVLDARTRQVVTTIRLPANGDRDEVGRPYPAGVVCCAVWTRDGTRLLLGTGGYLPGTLVDDAPRTPGELAVVDTSTWKVVREVVLDRVPEVIEPDPDGRWLAVAAANSDEVVVLDGDTLEERHRVALGQGDDDSLWAMSFSPDGRLLAGAGELAKMHVIDTGAWRARAAVPLGDEAAIQVQWLDDRTVMSSSTNGTVVLFDTERALMRTQPLPASVDRERGYAHLLPGSDREMVALNDQRVGLRYPMDPAVWLREACAVAGRDLTRAEWERYLPDRQWEPTCSDLG